MTRRQFAAGGALPAIAAFAGPAPLIVPIHRVLDSRAKITPEQLGRFNSTLWAETARDFRRCGIEFQTTAVTGEIRRSAGDRPIFVGVEKGVINLVLTDHIPLSWDHGRGLVGVTTIYDGYHLCVIALNSAHGHQVPFFSVNTCEHEILHALMQDIFVTRPTWQQSAGREFRIDWYASCLRLFHQGPAIRKSAEEYLRRLRTGS